MRHQKYLRLKIIDEKHTRFCENQSEFQQSFNSFSSSCLKKVRHTDFQTSEISSKSYQQTMTTGCSLKSHHILHYTYVMISLMVFVYAS